MTIDRETLAAQIFASEYPIRPSMYESCFEAADRFLAYAATQRKQPEPPKACAHRWVSINNGPERCFYCDAKEPAPKREARTFWLYRDRDDKPWEVKDYKPNYAWKYVVKCVEVLE